MRTLCLALILAAAPALADGEQGDMDRGMSLLDQGTRLLLQGLMAEVEPQLRDLAEQMGPALQDLKGMLGSLDAYHAPEILPNGDIIIRRKVPLRPRTDGEIEL